MAASAVLPTPRVNQTTGQIVAAMNVYSKLGPGLLESACEACLAHELRKQGLKVETQRVLPVVYDGEKVDLGYRIDLMVEECRPADQFSRCTFERRNKRMVDGKDWEK